MPDFETARNRDAWGTIRGFTFQASLTIGRWLELRAGQTLELERGEDIDLVARILGTDDRQETNRLLEQVKHLDSNVTLRSPAAVAAIANAFEHLWTNPDLALEFQFTTTARIGTERGDALQGAKGIELWEMLRLGQMAPADEPAKVEMIRAQLRLAIRPDDLLVDTWGLFQYRLRHASTAKLTEFIRGFRWLTGQPDLAVDWTSLNQRLIELGHAATMDEAQSLCERLFASVYRRLSTRGIKTLNADDLAAALRDPTLGELGPQKLRRLEAAQCYFETRLTSLGRAMVTAELQMRRLAREHFVLSEVVFAGQAVSLDPPVVADDLAPRTKAVAALATLWGEGVWLVLHGPVSTGKTHLAVLLGRRHDCRTWIHLEEKTGLEAVARLTAALAALAGEEVPVPLGSWLDDLCAGLGMGTAIVLNDLPRLTGNALLADWLVRLAVSAARHGVRLLSTSTEAPPPGFLSRLPSGAVVPQPVPNFDSEDTEELLRARGAPPEVIRRAGPLCDLGRRHAALVCALVEHLRAGGWNLDLEWFNAVLAGEHSDALDDETLARVLVTINNESDRELLYRLSLLTGRFGDEEVRTLCAVPPALVHPTQRVRALRGPWLHAEPGGLLRASPLLARLGAANLDAATLVDCYRQLSRVITSRPSINQTELLSALNYSIRGDEPGRAAALLAMGLSALIAQDAIKADNVLLAIWTDTPMPPEVPTAVRAHLRSLQIFACHRAGLSVSGLAEDLRLALSQSSDQPWLLVTAAALTVPAMLSAGMDVGFDLLRETVVRRDELLLPDGSPLGAPDGFSAEDLLWLPFEHPLSDETLVKWMEFFAGLPPEIRARASAGTMGALGAQAMATRPVVREAARPPADRRWNDVAALLAALIPRARAVGADLLWANLVRARLMVLGEHLGRLDGARDEAEAALRQAPDDPAVRLLLREHVGTLLANDPVRRPTGLEWLRQAVGEDTTYYSDQQASAALNLSWLLGEANPQDAIAPAEQAVEILRRDAERTPLELARAMAECAVAHWLAGDADRAAQSADEAGELIFSGWEESEERKAAIAPLGIMIPNLLFPRELGHPPPAPANGTPTPSVWRGMFFRSPPGSSDWYRPKLVVRLHFQLARLTELHGRPERADRWRAAGLERVAGGSSTLRGYLAVDHLTSMAAGGNLSGAMEEAIVAAINLEAASTPAPGGSDAGDAPANLPSSLGERPNDRWRRAEGLAAQHFVHAFGGHLLRLVQCDPSATREQAAEAARLCRARAATMIDAERWTKAGELFEEMSSENISAVRMGDYLSTVTGSDWRELLVLGLLAQSLAPRVTMVDAVEVQARAMRLAEPYLESFPVPAVKSVLPFLHDYWAKRQAFSRQAFRRPENVEEALRAARGLAPRDQAKRLFNVIAEGLGQAPDDVRTREWLANGEGRAVSPTEA